MLVTWGCGCMLFIPLKLRFEHEVHFHAQILLKCIDSWLVGWLVGRLVVLGLTAL